MSIPIRQTPVSDTLSFVVERHSEGGLKLLLECRPPNHQNLMAKRRSILDVNKQEKEVREPLPAPEDVTPHVVHDLPLDASTSPSASPGSPPERCLLLKQPQLDQLDSPLAIYPSTALASRVAFPFFLPQIISLFIHIISRALGAPWV